MIWKYFSYKDGDRWLINDLLSMDQCRAMLASLNWKYQVFASVQAYDEHGNIKSCPVFFDLDGAPNAVLADARHLVQILEYTVNVTPRIYFSGGKGFHLIIERPVVHPRAHELIRYFYVETCGEMIKTADAKVYRNRSLLRIPGSPGSKPGRFKVEVTRAELFSLSMEELGQLASKQRMIQTEHDPSKIDEQVWEAWIRQATAELPDYRKLDLVQREAASLELEFTPCLRSLLVAPPPPGERNSTVFLLARFFRSIGLDQATTFAIFQDYPHWRQFESDGREVNKVLSSVFKSRSQSLIGCKGSTDTARLMKAYCDEICHFRDDFPRRMFRRLPERYAG